MRMPTCVHTRMFLSLLYQYVEEHLQNKHVVLHLVCDGKVRHKKNTTQAVNLRRA